MKMTFFNQCRVKIGGGWTPTGKQITPTANAREKKLEGAGFDPPWA